ncbi:hypothetical protein StoSoilB22_29240 [Arthrobacter sp. StoSoilB22]|nr:hypothetical protein StoSoilB22_29240 [Arthrobacter sp. StoSoilB22]
MKEAGEREVNLPDFFHVQGVAEAAETEDVLFVEGLLHLRCKPGPRLTVQLYKRGSAVAISFGALQSHAHDSALRGADQEMRDEGQVNCEGWNPVNEQKEGGCPTSVVCTSR